MLLLTRPLDVVARNRKVRSKALQNSLQKYFNNFSLRSILRSPEVTKFSENFIFLRKCAIISETILVRRPGKENSIALELFFH